MIIIDEIKIEVCQLRQDIRYLQEQIQIYGKTELILQLNEKKERLKELTF